MAFVLIVEKLRKELPVEIKTKWASGYCTLDITDGSTTMSLGLLDQKEANEMALKFREAADQLYEDES